MDERKPTKILEERLNAEKILAWYANRDTDDSGKHSQYGYYRETSIDIPHLTSQYGAIVRFLNDGSDLDSGVGSGFFVRPNILVTAYHVVINDHSDPNAEGVLTKDGKFISLNRSKISKPNSLYFGGRDLSDLAIIEFGNDVHDQALKFSDEEPISSQAAVMIGYPHRIHYSEGIMTSFGDVSDFGRGLLHSIPAEQGYSGSPIFSLEGKVIGMHIISLDRDQKLGPDFIYKKSIPAYIILQALKEFQTQPQQNY